MGRRPRFRPAKLGAKLRRVREALELTQEEMLRRLDLPDEITQTNISRYERGVFDPPLNALLRYADLANVWLDVLVRDELELPDQLPSPVKHGGVPAKPLTRTSESVMRTKRAKT